MSDQTKPKRIPKHVPVRFSIEEHQFLHRIAPPGGIQKLLRSWIDPHLSEAREKQAGQSG
jgi:hypothetical protein